MAREPFLDTNILLYAFLIGDPRRERAKAVVARGGLISVQVAQEFVDVSRRKRGWTWEHVTAALDSLREVLGSPLALTDAMQRSALDIAQRYGLRIYDSMIVSAAKSAGCRVLYTEDLQHGQILDGVRVENPFATP